MPELRGQYFAGPTDLPAAALNKLTIAAPLHSILDALAADNWDGAPVATVTINTSVDGTRPADGKFALWGNLANGDIGIPAVKLWEGVAKGTTLHIGNIMGQQFTFPSGQLNSEYASQLPFEVSYSRAGTLINQQDWAMEGIGELSLRAICHLDKLSNRSPPPKVKFTILANPLTPLELAELADRTQHVSDQNRKKIVLEISAPKENRNQPPVFVEIFQTANRDSHANNGPHFRDDNGKPLTITALNKLLKKLLGEKTGISSHSFRIGAATAMGALGFANHEIQSLGRWKSDAYNRYIRRGKSARAVAVKAFSKNFANEN